MEGGSAKCWKKKDFWSLKIFISGLRHVIVMSGGCLRAAQKGTPARPVMRTKREQLCSGGS